VKQYGRYYFGAIALFIVVKYLDAGKISAGATGVSDITKSLQGRS
jgi:hypothetical protein